MATLAISVRSKNGVVGITVSTINSVRTQFFALSFLFESSKEDNNSLSIVYLETITAKLITAFVICKKNLAATHTNPLFSYIRVPGKEKFCRVLL